MVPFILHWFYRGGNRLGEVKWIAQDHITSKLRSLDSHPALGLQSPGADSPETTGLNQCQHSGYVLVCGESHVTPDNCEQSSRIHFHLHHANFPEYFSTLISDHGPVNPTLQSCVSLSHSKWSQSLSSPRGDARFLSCTSTSENQLARNSFLLSVSKFDWPMDIECINLTSCNIPHPTPIPLQESAWSLEPPPLGIQAAWAAETYGAPESSLCTIAASLGCSPACKGHCVMNPWLTLFSNQNCDLISGPAWLAHMVFLFL